MEITIQVTQAQVANTVRLWEAKTDTMWLEFLKKISPILVREKTNVFDKDTWNWGMKRKRAGEAAAGQSILNTSLRAIITPDYMCECYVESVWGFFGEALTEAHISRHGYKFLDPTYKGIPADWIARFYRATKNDAYRNFRHVAWSLPTGDDVLYSLKLSPAELSTWQEANS